MLARSAVRRENRCVQPRKIPKREPAIRNNTKNLKTADSQRRRRAKNPEAVANCAVRGQGIEKGRPGTDSTFQVVRQNRSRNPHERCLVCPFHRPRIQLASLNAGSEDWKITALDKTVQATNSTGIQTDAGWMRPLDTLS